jgi:hypothetical protein
MRNHIINLERQVVDLQVRWGTFLFPSIIFKQIASGDIHACAAVLLCTACCTDASLCRPGPLRLWQATAAHVLHASPWASLREASYACTACCAGLHRFSWLSQWQTARGSEAKPGQQLLMLAHTQPTFSSPFSLLCLQLEAVDRQVAELEGRSRDVSPAPSPLTRSPQKAASSGGGSRAAEAAGDDEGEGVVGTRSLAASSPSAAVGSHPAQELEMQGQEGREDETAEASQMAAVAAVAAVAATEPASPAAPAAAAAAAEQEGQPEPLAEPAATVPAAAATEVEAEEAVALDPAVAAAAAEGELVPEPEEAAGAPAAAAVQREEKQQVQVRGQQSWAAVNACPLLGVPSLH